MAKKTTMINNMTSGNVIRQLLLFAYPFMLSNLLQVVYTLVDMIVVGQFVGSYGLSGVAIGGEISMLFTMLCFGFTSAGQIMVSQYVGQDDHESIKSTIGTMFTSVALIGVVITVVSLLCVDPLLRLMNTPVESYKQARDYAVVCFVGTIFTYGYNTVGSVLRGMGDSKRPFIFVTIAAVLNLILDLIFVAVLRMDTLGAALATVIGQSVSFIISLFYLYRHKEAFGFDFKLSSFRMHGQKLKIILKLSVPLMISSIAISMSLTFINSFVNPYGVVASAVNGVGGKLSSLMQVVTHAIQPAVGAFVGQNMGAGKPERARKAVWCALGIALVFWVVIAALCLLFPRA
ncbi:MAG: MATE family efflux transporter, partial [Clostridia bacterium]|nr:MATE family efflux transporter [Clostridia bacterium]